jgi:hypothetical protein
MKRIMIFSAISAFVAACSSSISVTSDYDQDYDFASVKTAEYYGWADNSDQIMTRFDKERIEKAFAEEFKSRGIEFVPKGQGDIIVSLYIVTEQKQETQATTTNMGGGYGYGGYYGYGPGYGWGGGTSYTTVNTYDYTVGTLLVSVFDAQKEQLVWQSAGVGTVQENEKGREERIKRAVQYIMAKYPIKPMAGK